MPSTNNLSVELLGLIDRLSTLAVKAERSGHAVLACELCESVSTLTRSTDLLLSDQLDAARQVEQVLVVHVRPRD